MPLPVFSFSRFSFLLHAAMPRQPLGIIFTPPSAFWREGNRLRRRRHTFRCLSPIVVACRLFLPAPQHRSSCSLMSLLSFSGIMGRDRGRSIAGMPPVPGHFPLPRLFCLFLGGIYAHRLSVVHSISRRQRLPPPRCHARPPRRLPPPIFEVFPFLLIFNADDAMPPLNCRRRRRHAIFQASGHIEFVMLHYFHAAAVIFLPHWRSRLFLPVFRAAFLQALGRD